MQRKVLKQLTIGIQRFLESGIHTARIRNPESGIHSVESVSCNTTNTTIC